MYAAEIYNKNNITCHFHMLTLNRQWSKFHKKYTRACLKVMCGQNALNTISG